MSSTMDDDKIAYPQEAPPVAPAYGSGFGVAPYQHGSGYVAITTYGGDEVPLATRWSRLGARLLDGLIVMLGATPGAAMYVLNGSKLEMTPIMLIAVGVLGISIYQWVRVVQSGQTLGKRALNIKVVKNDGSPVGFVDGIILREWVVAFMGVIPFIGRFIQLIDWLMIFGADQRCLHDQIAKTKVIAVLPGLPD